MKPADDTGGTRAPARPQRRIPIALGLVALVLVVARQFQPAVVDGVAWAPADQALALSAASGKPVLYDFSAAWCGPCRQMERRVFANPEAAAFINERFVPVKVMDRKVEEGKNPPAVDALQARYDVDSFPTLVAARPDGSLVVRSDGFQGEVEMREFLNRVLSRYGRGR